ncbi:MAG: lamin tail domain-containing protein [Chitinispirillaceae bacterium]
MIHRVMVCITAVFIQVQALGVVITEVHRDPLGRESDLPGGRSHEFVEITNLGKAAFCIDRLFLTDGMDADSVIPFGEPLEEHENCRFNARCIPPGKVAVVLDRDYRVALDNDPGCALPIDSGALLFTVADGDLGNGLAGDDGVMLYKGTASLVDSVVDIASDMENSSASPVSGKIFCSPRKSPEGFSVIPNSFFFDTGEYVLCADSLSPGRCEKLNKGAFVDYKIENVDGAALCSLVVLRLFESKECAFRLFALLDNGLEKVIDEGVLASDYKNVLSFNLEFKPVMYRFELLLNSEKIVCDLDISSLWVPEGAVKITELFPRATAEEPEWIELVNTSSMDINLKDWSFGNSEDTAVISVTDFILASGGFLVLTRNTASMKSRHFALSQILQTARWHALNNYNDTVCVWSPEGQMVDRICYHNEWFSGWKGQSLEKVETSLSGLEATSWVLNPRPTPGLPGRSTVWRSTVSPSLDIGPVPFTPNGDGRDDFLSIQMKVPVGYKARVSIFGFDGRELVEFSRMREVILWDGSYDGARSAPPGVFLVVAEFTSEEKRVVIRKKGVLWR